MTVVDMKETLSTAVEYDDNDEDVDDSVTARFVNNKDGQRGESSATLVTVEGGEEEEESSSTQGVLESMQLPLLQYSQIRIRSSEDGTMTSSVGTTTTSSSSTCSALSQVLVQSDGGSSGSSVGGSGTGTGGVGETTDSLPIDLSLWNQHPVCILSRGYQDGTIQLSCPTSLPICYDMTQFIVREKATWTRSSPIVAISWDSTGSYLGAIDASGVCCIWELRYSPSTMMIMKKNDIPPPSTTTTTTTTTTDATRLTTSVPGTSASSSTIPTSSSHPSSSTATSGMFSGLMTRLTGVPPSASEGNQTQTTAPVVPMTGNPMTTTTATTNATTTGANNIPTTPIPPRSMITVPSLKVDVISTSRITYPTQWKSPTTLVLDPSHKRRMALLVGLEDGRLLYTKRGGIFARRNDSVLYQGSGPIEAITWRGNLVAWADNSGIKLLDIESLTRIAHIDRPEGARSTLYPTIRNLRPWIYFETSDRLLIAWGDCLMQMTVDETPTQGEGTSITTRRSVTCSMAWELDGIATGVVPFDEERIAVLAIILPHQQEQSDDAEYNSKLSIRAESNELELQIISRDDGTIQYADILPYHSQSSLQSTFALSRMDDASEWNEYKSWKGYDDGTFDLTLITGNGSTGPGPAGSTMMVNGNGSTGSTFTSRANVFVDPHLQWNLKSVLFEETPLGQTTEDTDDDDVNSIDSDDYGFVRRPLNLLDDPGPSTSPPLIVLASESDAILASLSSVDDAVEHALLIQNRPALSLKRALQHRRQLRRYRIADLVQHYLEAVLRLHDEEASVESLSLRRMTLAVQTMPALLGGDMDLWAHWATALQKLPGALFLLRSYLPVRDPVLPSKLYFQVLEGMYREYEQLSNSEDETVANLSLRQKAAHHFLESIIAWGPTKGLNEFIKLYQYSREKGVKTATEHLIRLQRALNRRHTQTAADFLKFPIRSEQMEESRSVPTASRYNADDGQDSLYSLDSALTLISPKAQGLSLQQSLNGAKTINLVTDLNDQVNLDAGARILIMQGRYEQALRAYLSIGALHSSLSMEELNAWAIDVVQNGSGSKLDRKVRISGISYEFVLGLVEHYHLHRVFLEPIKGKAPNKFQPLLALLRLVGLKRTGDFLIEHCAAPELQVTNDRGMFGDDTVDAQRPETMPLDQVAQQLESTPALMHWYLNLVFLKRPEYYVKFPNHSMPPDVVTELHRKHFELHIQYAGDTADSSRVLSRLEIYRVESSSTPLLRFLKVRDPILCDYPNRSDGCCLISFLHPPPFRLRSQ